MPKKTHKLVEIAANPRQADLLIERGSKIPDVVRTMGATQVTYCHGRIMDLLQTKLPHFG